MSVVDAPPGIDRAGLAAGEFRARKRPRRLARISFVLCLGDAALCWYLASQQRIMRGTTILIIGPLVCLSIAAVGLAVRSARLRIDRGGVGWLLGAMQFRIGRDRIDRIRVFDTAAAIAAKRGSTWYLSSYDWERFDDFLHAFSEAELSPERCEGKAPFRARLQGYGWVLDGLMLLSVLGSFLLLVFAALR